MAPRRPSSGALLILGAFAAAGAAMLAVPHPSLFRGQAKGADSVVCGCPCEDTTADQCVAQGGAMFTYDLPDPMGTCTNYCADLGGGSSSSAGTASSGATSSSSSSSAATADLTVKVQQCTCVASSYTCTVSVTNKGPGDVAWVSAQLRLAQGATVTIQSETPMTGDATVPTRPDSNNAIVQWESMSLPDTLAVSETTTATVSFAPGPAQGGAGSFTFAILGSPLPDSVTGNNSVTKTLDSAACSSSSSSSSTSSSSRSSSSSTSGTSASSNSSSSVCSACVGSCAAETPYCDWENQPTCSGTNAVTCSNNAVANCDVAGTVVCKSGVMGFGTPGCAPTQACIDCVANQCGSSSSSRSSSSSGTSSSACIPSGTPNPVEYIIPTPARPFGITKGPDGNVWFAGAGDDSGTGIIGKITTQGVITEYPALTNDKPKAITTGPDGNLWFTANEKIGRMTPSGSLVEYSFPSTSIRGPLSIITGPDDNLWFTENSGKKVGKITTSGVLKEYDLFYQGIDYGASPLDIVVGPDNNLWVTDYGGQAIYKITTGGIVTRYTHSTWNLPGHTPAWMAVGSDGDIWFTEVAGHYIGKITTGGVITEYAQFNLSFPEDIVAGPDGNLWIAEGGTPPPNMLKISVSPTMTKYPFSAAYNDGGPTQMAVGADGNIWFTNYGHNAIGKFMIGTSCSSSSSSSSVSVCSACVSACPQATEMPYCDFANRPTCTATNAVCSGGGTASCVLGNVKCSSGTPGCALSAACLQCIQANCVGSSSSTLSSSSSRNSSASTTSSNSSQSSGTSTSSAQSSSSSSSRVPFCGNGWVEAAEGCDDGNLNNNDCCDSACRIESGCMCVNSGAGGAGAGGAAGGGAAGGGAAGGGAVGGGGGAGGGGVGPTNGLVARYTFDPAAVQGSLVLDMAGNGLGGTLQGGAAPVNGCMYFDGVDDRVDIPNMDRQVFTFTAWAKKQDGGNGYALIAAKDNSGWAVGFGGGPGALFWGHVGAKPVYFGKMGTAVATSTLIAPDVWRHIAVTYDGTTVQIFIDGRFDSTFNYPQTLGPGGIYHLGFRDAIPSNAVSNSRYKGYMDDVRIYSRVLTASEVSQIAQTRPSCESQSGLIAHYTFDDVSGTTVPDSSGNGNNGQSFNGANAVNSCMYFDGVDDRVDIPNMDRQVFTFTAWAKKQDGGNGTPALIASKDDSGWAVGFGGGPGALFWGITGAKPVFFGKEGSNVATTTLIAPDVWRHIAVTYDGTTVQIFIDGQLDSTFNYPQTLGPGGIYHLGFRDAIPSNAISNSRYKGYMDDVRIYDRVLTASDISQIAQTRPSCGP